MSIGFGIFLSSLILGLVAIYIVKKVSLNTNNINIFGGIDRIAIVVAVLSILPIFMGSGVFYSEKVHVAKNPEYELWEKEHEVTDESVTLEDGRTFKTGPANYYLRNPHPEYLPQSPSQIAASVIAAFVTSLLGYLIVLYGIRYGTRFGYRGIKWFVLWIYEGFKE